MNKDKESLVKVGLWGRSLAFRIPTSVVSMHSLQSNDVLRVSLSSGGFIANIVRHEDIVIEEKALIRSICGEHK